MKNAKPLAGRLVAGFITALALSSITIAAQQVLDTDTVTILGTYTVTLTELSEEGTTPGSDELKACAAKNGKGAVIYSLTEDGGVTDVFGYFCAVPTDVN